MKKQLSPTIQTHSSPKPMWLLLLIVFVLTSLSHTSFAKKQQNKNVLNKLKLKNNDEKANEIKSMKAEVLIRKSEIKAINQLKRLIKKHKGKALEPDLLFRLTELYMRRVKAERFFEIHRESNAVVSLLPKLVKNASSKKYIKKSIKIYDYIIRKYPKYNQIDMVLFNNAFARQEVADYKVSEKLYWRIIKKHPNSSLIPDAHLAIGEIAFIDKRFDHALKHFMAIKKYPQSKVYPYGLYKSGWAMYNLNRATEGIKELEKVILFSRSIEDKKKRSNFNLLSEALQDLTLFYQEVYEAKNAYKYFQSITKGDELAEVLISLSGIYKRHGKFDAVNDILSEFNTKNPKHEKTPEVLDELAWNFENLRNRKKSEEYLVKLNKYCTTVKDEDCKERVIDTSLSLGHKWRNLWVKNNKNEIFGAPTETAFKIYISNTPINEDSLEVRFLMAEMLFAREKYREASRHYNIIAVNETKKERKHDSAYAAIVSLQKAVKDKWDQNDHSEYNRLANMYLNTFKKGKYRLDIQFKMALIPYEKNQFEVAKPIFYKLGNLYPKAKKGLKSQDLYLDILNHSKDYPAIKKYTQLLLKKSGNKKRIAELKKVYEEAYFLQIQGFEKENKLKLAFTEYEKFSKQNSLSPLAPKALWNSALLQVKRKLPVQAASQFEKYERTYPKTSEAKDALIQAANIYEELSDLKNAARVLVKLSTVDKENSIKWKQVAAEYFYVEEDFNKSLQIFEKLATNKNNQIRFESIDKIILIIKNLRDKTKDVEKTKSLMKTVLKNGNTNQKHFALVERAKKLYDQKKYPAAFKLTMDINKYSKDSVIKSQVRLIQADILKKELEAQSLKTTIQRIPTVLGLKIERLDKAQRAYLSTIKYGNPENNALAMYNLSLCYKNYIESLRNMPAPRGLPKDQEEGFREEISTIISPIEDKYVETLNQAYVTAKRQHSTNIDLNNIRSELLRLKVSLNFETLSHLKLPTNEFADVSRLPAGGKK